MPRCRKKNMNSTCTDEQHALEHYLFPIVYVFVVILSIPANVGSLCVSLLQAKKGNELGIYLCSLSLSDLLYALTLPLWIHYTWNQDNWAFSAALCKGCAFFTYMNFYSSTAFLTCIAVDRYLAVVHPLKFFVLRTRRFAFLASLSIWAAETIFNAAILWEEEVFTEYCGPNKSTFTLCYDRYPLADWQIRFNLFRTGTGYALPLLIIMVCNGKVYRAVRQNQATENREKRRIIRLLATLTLTFVLCFTPFHVMLLLRSVLEPRVGPQLGKQTYKMYRITVALTSLNCVADPILYCFVTESGRADMWTMLKLCAGNLTASQRQRRSAFSTSTKDIVELDTLE